MKTWWILFVGLGLAVVGCFDSIVNDTCQSGFAMSRGVCVVQSLVDAGIRPPDGSDVGPPDATPDARPDAGTDAGAIVDAAPMIDAAPMPDAAVCALPSLDCRGMCIDVTSDPDNCGGCGRICASGVCSQGVCAGELRGHIVAIGHDYRSFHPAMARVLGDSVALGVHFDVGVARWHGTAGIASQSGTTAAIAVAMQQLARPWHDVALPATPSSSFAGIDVVVIDAQLGDGDAAQASAAPWSAALDSFVTAGGVVIVLEGTGGVSYRVARGAGLYNIAAPVDATGQLAFVVDGADVTTQQVVSPYLAETTSVTLPGAPSSAISTLMGAAIVFHLTR